MRTVRCQLLFSVYLMFGMGSSSCVLLLLLPYVVHGAVVPDPRNFIQVPEVCNPPFAFVDDRCVFVVQREDSDELECSEDSEIPCEKEDYTTKSVLPGEKAIYEDVITSDTNKNQLQNGPHKRTFTGTRDCKRGYRFIWGKCREVFNGVKDRIDETITQELDGDFNNIDSQNEDIYNIKPETDQTKTEMEQRSVMGVLKRCKPGYRPDIKGRCRQVLSPASSNAQKESKSRAASAKGFIDAPCRPGYMRDEKGNCREDITSSNTQKKRSSYGSPAKGFIDAPCRPGYLRDEKGNCREDITSSNTQKKLSSYGLPAKGFINAPCRPGYLRDEKGNCREVFNLSSPNTQKGQSKGLIQTGMLPCKPGYRPDRHGKCREIFIPGNSEKESTKGLIQVQGCAAGSVSIEGDCRPIYIGKRQVYGEDYADTNERSLTQSGLRRRRSSLRN